MLQLPRATLVGCETCTRHMVNGRACSTAKATEANNGSDLRQPVQPK